MNLNEEISRHHQLMLSEANQKIRGLYLTFPKAGWETIGAKLMKLFGVVSGVFKSSGDAIDKIRNVKNKTSETLDEFVVGSHGGGQELFMSQKGEQPDALVKILNEANHLWKFNVDGQADNNSWFLNSYRATSN